MVLGNGFFGNRIQQAMSCKVYGGRISSFSQAQSLAKKYKPSLIINCIGHTGINVDDCELDKDKTLLANCFLPVILAEVALRNNIRLVHISSGCIYHYNHLKDKPIDEDRAPDFFDLFYSRTKIYAEQALQALSSKYPILILRPRVPLDDIPHPRNLLTKLLTFNRIIDIPASVTYVPDFIRAMKHLIKIKATGIYNVVNSGRLRYTELLDIYKKYDQDFKYRKVNFNKLGLVRTNVVLSNRKLKNSGFLMPDIHEVLEGCVKNYLAY